MAGEGELWRHWSKRVEGLQETGWKGQVVEAQLNGKWGEGRSRFLFGSHFDSVTLGHLPQSLGFSFFPLI